MSDRALGWVAVFVVLLALFTVVASCMRYQYPLYSDPPRPSQEAR